MDCQIWTTNVDSVCVQVEPCHQYVGVVRRSSWIVDLLALYPNVKKSSHTGGTHLVKNAKVCCPTGVVRTELASAQPGAP